MRKLLTLNKDGKLALRGANGESEVVPLRRARNVLLLIDVSGSMAVVDTLADGRVLVDEDGAKDSSAMGRQRKAARSLLARLAGKDTQPRLRFSRTVQLWFVTYPRTGRTCSQNCETSSRYARL